MATTQDLETRFTASGVRLRARTRRPGDVDWLFLPGGPGIGSESLHELVDALDVPGTCWLVDLPGDGSNTDAPGAPADPFSAWPHAVVEAARAVRRPVFLGHSTGGMYLLATPELEELLEGLVLISTAPTADWMPAFIAMTETNPLPAVTAATERYEADPSDANLREIAVESATWNFTPEGVEAGAELLGRMPYNGAAVAWSDAHFDHTYEAAWFPEELPTLIVSGGADRIVTQRLWDEPQYDGDHVLRRRIDGGAHFPWIERPDAMKKAFADFAVHLSTWTSG
ncbi:alpha/beta hydrolase [Solirubrobacter phytolaccae]|uniref:Alpha/beta hydrolase n=1 Tax=Solirubrobacter phytolaccae TaxID=1404360 RepID=A0A9X3N4T1_9ACTN|nr:alpha/beta hydrolase [Solirubrobacter phytolaccae]MDA0179860.1 alpha/beta hydrolase [Solirubrobacter phytolaccae]